MESVLIALKTYQSYAKKYNINVTKNGKYKTMKQLSKEIKKYELKNTPDKPLLIRYGK